MLSALFLVILLVMYLTIRTDMLGSRGLTVNLSSILTGLFIVGACIMLFVSASYERMWLEQDLTRTQVYKSEIYTYQNLAPLVKKDDAGNPTQVVFPIGEGRIRTFLVNPKSRVGEDAVIVSFLRNPRETPRVEVIEEVIGKPTTLACIKNALGCLWFNLSTKLRYTYTIYVHP